MGRFISADTLVPDPTNPQSYSRYSYVGNRPLSFTDPTGHAETPYDLGGGGGFGPIDDRHSSPERELGMMFIRIGLYVAATAAVKEAVDDVLGQAEGVINSTPELGNRDYFPAPLDWPTNDNNGDNRVVWRLMSFGTGLEQFNGRPKPNDWDGLSGTYADQWASPMEWFEQTVGKERPWQPGQDAIYATTVGELNAVGFDVRSTPNNIDPGHVSLGGVTPGIVNRGANASWPGNKTERAAYETLFLSAFKPNFQ